MIFASWGYWIMENKEKKIALTVRLSPEQYDKMMKYLVKHRLRKQQAFIEFAIQYAIDNEASPPPDY